MVVGSRRLLCEGLEALFRGVCPQQAVCAVTGAGAGMEQALHFRPDVVLIDLKLSEGGALAVARFVRSHCPRARFVFLDEVFHEGRLGAVLKFRAAGYITQDDSFARVLEAVRRVGCGGRAFCSAAEAHLVRVGGKLHCKTPADSAGLSRLTRREFEVLVLLAQGLTVKECAGHLNIAPSTADNHKSRLMAKLGVHKVVDLVHLAIREGLLEPSRDRLAGTQTSDA